MIVNKSGDSRRIYSRDVYLTGDRPAPDLLVEDKERRREDGGFPATVHATFVDQGRFGVGRQNLGEE